MPPFLRGISVRDAARRSRKTVPASASTTATVASASRAALEGCEALRTRWKMRPARTPTHARVKAGPALARSRLAEQLSGRACRRGCGPAFRGRR